VLEEAGADPAVVLIQDYHFTLLPRMLKRRNPALKVAHFWHIPWPAPETIRILPWRQEILEGLSANDLLGFHLPEHCDAFRAAVARNLGPAAAAPAAAVRAFPISIDFDGHSRAAASPAVTDGIAQWRREIGGAPEILGIGIDRIDYTKGIPERLAALDLLFEEHPEYLGRLVFVQIGVPSRGEIPEYRALQDEIAALVDQINARWSTAHWKPIVYLARRCDRQSLIALHLLADFCVVSSLHDGMNLVAKEFVASRIDEDGVLVLSEFAGAAHELRDALIVNPYSVADIARRMHDAIAMEPHERRRRMAAMRRAVAANNIYRWGAGLLSALAAVTHKDAYYKDTYERRLALSA
jgi:trehalose 6-phosphate synthase